MKTLTLLFLSGAIGSATSLQAQFPLVNTSPEIIVTLGSLSAGVRYVDFLTQTNTAGVRTVYNTDLSVYRELNFPAPPPGMNWANMRYITDELFDTDPTTIEFVMTAYPQNGPGNFGVFVYREDGTEIFSQFPGSMVSGVGGDLEGFGPIYTTDDGTFMLLHTVAVLGPPVNIYQLPGTLPCRDCFGAPHSTEIGTGGVSIVDPSSGMALFPNPSMNEVQLRFTSQEADRVLILDATGREVLSQPTNGATSLVLNTSHLAVGKYTVMASRKTVRVGSLPLLIVR